MTDDPHIARSDAPAAALQCNFPCSVAAIRLMCNTSCDTSCDVNADLQQSACTVACSVAPQAVRSASRPPLAERSWCAPFGTRSTRCTWATRSALSPTTLCSSITPCGRRRATHGSLSSRQGERWMTICCCACLATLHAVGTTVVMLPACTLHCMNLQPHTTTPLLRSAVLKNDELMAITFLTVCAACSPPRSAVLKNGEF